LCGLARCAPRILEHMKSTVTLGLLAGMWQLKHSEWLMAFTEGCIFMLANSERAKNSMKGMIDTLPATFTKRVEVLTRDKSDKNKSNFGLIIAGLKASKRGSKVGCAMADKVTGSFASSWESALAESGLEVADVTEDLWEVVSAHKRPEVSHCPGHPVQAATSPSHRQEIDVDQDQPIDPCVG
jgi:nucleosome binding factor SPN SPT16 subunit